MSRKAFILVPFLVLFSVLISLIESVALNEFYRKREFMNASQIDQFSLLEIETIRRIKKEFISFDPKDFSFEAGEWIISVDFEDESALIHYEGPQSVMAILEYDMVMENVLDYQLLDDAQSDID